MEGHSKKMTEREQRVAEFEQFIRFCLPREAKGDPVEQIWNEWKKEEFVKNEQKQKQ